MSAAEIVGDDLRVNFSAPWDLAGHELFLRAKKLPEARCEFDRDRDSYTLVAPARFASLLGLTHQAPTAAGLPMNPLLFDYQQWIVEKAVEAKRFAIWADCGLGKTVMFLEWARQVQHRIKGRLLILSPKNIIRQTVGEAEKFYGGELSLRVLHTREELAAWCKSGPEPFAICNYEKFIPGVIEEIRWCAGVALDESSVLKSGGGVIKWNLIKSCRGVEYKTSWTATPAPNDTIEYASQASFLEKMRTDNEIIWTFFYRDQKTQEWKVRPHAKEAFYRFMSSWSIYLRKPSAYGFEDKWDMPEPLITEHRIEMTDAQLGAYRYWNRQKSNDLFAPERLGIKERSKLSQIAKGFIYHDTGPTVRIASNKPNLVADLVKAALNEGRHPLVWTVFDEESEIIMERLSGHNVASLHGKDKMHERDEKLEAYRTGKLGGLVSKAKLLGYGMNFPFCSTMIFSGFDDSFESFYQAIRRAHRYGATQQLTVHVPFIPELEQHMWSNLLRKKTQWEADAAIQEANYANTMKRL